jgi:hypothetical protein
VSARLLSLLVCCCVILAPGAGASEPSSPHAYEAFFGYVKSDAPPGATRVEVFLGDRRVAQAPVRGASVAVRVPAPPGRYDLRLRFEAEGRLLRRDEARGVWLLPRTAQRTVRERRRDRTLERRLGALGGAFPGYAAVWVHDLVSGRTAGWNSDASFPAASTVKLGVLVAALDRFGPHPERSSAWQDIRDLATWSSNLASNRLLVRLGGSESGGTAIVNATLRRLGALDSAFSGNYRLGTSVARDTPRPLPIVTYRRTTAHDLGRILFELHAAALGNRLSLRRTGLDRHEARVALGLLLSSDPRGDNLGLLRPALGRSVPLAQKNGWTTYLRHTAALVYGARGPRIVVVLTYRPELDPAASLALGRRVIALLDRR